MTMCENSKQQQYQCAALFNCCDCGGEDCGCSYCWSCNACTECQEEAKGN